MARTPSRKAKYLRTLVYVDEPQLILLQAGKQKVLATAVALDGYELPFLAVSVSEGDWQRYLRGYVDLRYLFVYSRKRRIFTFDLQKVSGDDVRLTPWDEEQDVPEELLPSPKFFSEDHTEPLEMEEYHLSTQRFGIDGEWELPEFAQFYGKYSDMYAFILAVTKFKAKATTQEAKRAIKEAFSFHPLRGGSSYRNLYADLYASQAVSESLGVRSMQYASPGHVDVNGRGEIFTHARSAIINFQDNSEEIRRVYLDLRQFLSVAGLLKIGVKRFDPKSGIAEPIYQRAIKLANLLKMQDVDVVESLTDGNQLAFAKVVMSYYRRVEHSFLFFAEGRVEFAGVTS